MKYIIEFKHGHTWSRSANKTLDGRKLDDVVFDNKGCAQAEADRQRKYCGMEYRVTEIEGEKMKIGEHEVTNITRDKVKVGCQEVTRGDIEKVLEAMNTAPTFSLKVATGSVHLPGAVWLEQREGAVRMFVRGKDDTAWAVVDLTAKGLHRHGYFTENSGLEHEAGKSQPRVVKLLE